MAEDKRLFFLDAYALIFRAYYSFISNPRINSRGMNTSAIFGFTNTLWSLLQKEKPTHIAVVFDPPGDKSFRTEQFEDYKANRGATPEDIKLAVPYIKEIIKAFRIPTLEVPGFEADDTIGTLAKKGAQAGYTVYMMTPDKDFGQLVEERIFIYKPAKNGGSPEIMGVKEVCERYGIERPEQVIDLLGMMGDAVDNIPGIEGVGEKTAIKFVQQFGSLEGLYENTAQLSGKMKEKVEACRDIAFLSKQLATIALDAPIDLDEEALTMEEPDKVRLVEIFEELEFRQLAKNILGEEIAVVKAAPNARGDKPDAQMNLFGGGGDEVSEAASLPTVLKTIADTDHHYHLADTPALRAVLIEKLALQSSFCFDTETTGTDAHQAQLVGLSFSFNAGEAYYVPTPPDQNEAAQIVAEFKAVFENEAIEKAGQNLKYDIEMLQRYGVRVSGPLFDTMIAHFLLNPETPNNMDDMAKFYLAYQPIPIEALIGEKGKTQGNMRDVAIEKIKDYAAEDADITWQLKCALNKELEAHPHAQKLLAEMECPLIRVLADMEGEGINLDSAALKVMGAELDEDAVKLRGEVFAMAGLEFNLDSPKQLGEVLFEHLKIDDHPKKTKTGQYQTNEATLEKLASKHAIISKILDYRSVRKLKSTYVDSLPEMVNPLTGRIHTNYMQTVAATGRLSSNNPNLQNIPIRTARGREIRKAFIPRSSDFLILSADYSQVELRIIAAISGDEGMIAAFRQGLDIHAATAAKVFGVALSEVSREMRSKAKAVNFGIAYGQGAFGLADTLGISRTEAKEIIDNYFAQFPRLLQYKETSVALAREKGYAETIMGRRRYLADINSKNHVVRSAAERNAINAPIQGSAADIIKVAMINLHTALKREKVRSKMLLQVHDELVFDAHKDEVEIITPIIRSAMENAYPLTVPLVVDINTGNNWLEAH